MPSASGTRRWVFVEQRLVRKRRFRAFTIHRQKCDERERLASSVLERRFTFSRNEFLPLRASTFEMSQ